MPLRVVGDADPAGRCNPFKARRNVDPVAKDIVVVDDDISDMDADAVLDSDVLQDVGIQFRHYALDFNRATCGVDGAGKFGEYAVTRRLDDAASMGGYGGINKRLSDHL